MVLGGFWVGRDLGGMGRANRTQCARAAPGGASGASSLSKRKPPNPQTVGVGVEVGVEVEVQPSTDGCRRLPTQNLPTQLLKKRHGDGEKDERMDDATGAAAAAAAAAAAGALTSDKMQKRRTRQTSTRFSPTHLSKKGSGKKG